MSKMRFVLLGMFSYTVMTFPLAAIWHVVLLKSQYEDFGYFEGDLSFALGFAIIMLQGAILSFFCTRSDFSGGTLSRCFKYVAVVGSFFWTSHVLALVAKQQVPNALQFIAIETLYLIAQFGLFGVVLYIISTNWRRSSV